MAFDQQVDGIADGFAHGTHDIHAEIEILTRERSPGASKRIELECGIAAPSDGLRFLGEGLRRPWTAIPTVGIGTQLFMALAAPELVERLIGGLADDVATGDL